MILYKNQPHKWGGKIYPLGGAFSVPAWDTFEHYSLGGRRDANAGKWIS